MLRMIPMDEGVEPRTASENPELECLSSCLETQSCSLWEETMGLGDEEIQGLMEEATAGKLINRLGYCLPK